MVHPFLQICLSRNGEYSPGTLVFVGNFLWGQYVSTLVVRLRAVGHTVQRLAEWMNRSRKGLSNLAPSRALADGKHFSATLDAGELLALRAGVTAGRTGPLALFANSPYWWPRDEQPPELPQPDEAFAALAAFEDWLLREHGHDHLSRIARWEESVVADLAAVRAETGLSEDEFFEVFSGGARAHNVSVRGAGQIRDEMGSRVYPLVRARLLRLERLYWMVSAEIDIESSEVVDG